MVSGRAIASSVYMFRWTPAKASVRDWTSPRQFWSDTSTWIRGRAWENCDVKVVTWSGEANKREFLLKNGPPAGSRTELKTVVWVESFSTSSAVA